MRRVEVLVEGTWVELQDAFSLEVLERCSGAATSAQLAAEIVDESEGSIAPSEVEARLRELYAKRLIAMRGAE